MCYGNLANHCDDIKGIFKNQDFWEFAERVKKASNKDGLSPEFSEFWDLLKPEIRNHNTVLTSSNKVVLPASAVFLDTSELFSAEKIFRDLDICTVHPDLRSRQNLLLETGVQNLKLAEICESFFEKGLTKRIELSSMPEELKSLEGWKLLWEAIENLWNRSYSYEKPQCQELLKKISIAFGDDNALWPPRTFNADQHTRKFFSKFSPIVWYQDKSDGQLLLKELIPQFSLGDGRRLLEENEEILPELWKNGTFSPHEMLEWFQEYRFEITQGDAKGIRDLCIWPTADGELNPLTNLFLAGDFEDPLRLTKLVDLDALGGVVICLKEF